MRVVVIKSILLLLTLVPNNNYILKETRKHTCHFKKINSIILNSKAIRLLIHLPKATKLLIQVTVISLKIILPCH